MHTLPVQLEGSLRIALTVHGDDPGFFAETFRADAPAEFGVDFVQDNDSRSRQGVVRGRHCRSHGRNPLARRRAR